MSVIVDGVEFIGSFAGEAAHSRDWSVRPLAGGPLALIVVVSGQTGREYAQSKTIFNTERDAWAAVPASRRNPLDRNRGA